MEVCWPSGPMPRQKVLSKYPSIETVYRSKHRGCPPMRWKDNNKKTAGLSLTSTKEG